MDKNSIRKMMKNKRLFMNKETFFIDSQIIAKHLLKHEKYLNSKIIGIYVSLNNEVETKELIKEMLKDHVVCVPKVEGHVMHFYKINSLDDLKEGCFHILEPLQHMYIDPHDIELMIVPLLAYDSKNHRVGYGKGYYDRYFANGFHGYKIGLAFSFQKVDTIDIHPNDYPLDEIITEKMEKTYNEV